MRLYPSKKIPSFYLILILIFFSRLNLYAQPSVSMELQKQARIYRSQGLKLQKQGNIDGAISYYQKAILLDTNYVLAYNDLGIVFEAKGRFERAKEMYLKAIAIDPSYPNSYSNLALLYESQGDFTNAALCWIKRKNLSYFLDDPWAEKAREHIKDIARLHPEDFSRVPDQYKKAPRYLAEPEPPYLTEALPSLTETRVKVKAPKPPGMILDTKEQDRKTRALEYLERAQASFSRGDYVTALRQATQAEYLDSSNKEISAFVEKVRKIILR